MASVPLPPKFYDQPEEAPRGPGWLAYLVKFLIFAGALAAAAWGGYYFYWQRRLPQDFTLIDRLGAAHPVQLKGRSGEIIQYTADGTTVYRAIGSFTPVQQAFLRRLANTFTTKFPQPFTLTDVQGAAREIQIEARNPEWIQYTLPGETSPRFVAFASLSPADQAALQALPALLALKYPLVYTLPDAQGKMVPVRLEGQSGGLVKYTTVGDKITRLVSLDALPKDDQAFISKLPTALRLQYPVERGLTDTAGKTFTASIVGRSRDALRYSLPGESTSRFIPLALLSETDQKIAQQLPENVTLRPPFEHVLTDAEGNEVPGRVAGRNEVVVRLDAAEAPRYFALAALSERDQALLQLLPADLKVEYPIDCTITGKDGKSFHVNITGRDLVLVRFTLPPDPGPKSTAIENLIAADQAFLRLLPVTSTGPRGASASATLIVNLQKRIEDINKQIADMSARASNPSTPSSERMALETRIKRANDDLAATTQQLQDAQAAAAARGGP